MDKISSDEVAAEQRAGPPKLPPLEVDDSTIALLAGLRDTLSASGQTVAWGACDGVQVDSLKHILNMASEQAAKKQAVSAAASAAAAAAAAAASGVSAENVSEVRIDGADVPVDDDDQLIAKLARMSQASSASGLKTPDRRPGQGLAPTTVASAPTSHSPTSPV